MKHQNKYNYLVIERLEYEEQFEVLGIFKTPDEAFNYKDKIVTDYTLHYRVMVEVAV
jgi:hypothetical protein